MIIIGERINSSRKKINEAIASKNGEFIKQEAKIQADAGVQYLDVNCAMSLDKELEDLEWVIKNIRQITNLPVCIDSPNPGAIEKGLVLLKGEKIFINSITLEDEKLKALLPLIKKYAPDVIALTIGQNGMPQTARERLDIAEKILTRVREFDISQDSIYFDLLIQPVSTQQNQAMAFLEALREAKKNGLKTICGLSNISFGLPRRNIINSAFLASAMALGIDAVIIDLTDEMMSNSVLAMNVLLDRDSYCRNYLKKMRNK